MNRYLLSIISLATLGLQAAEFSHKVEFTPAEATERGEKAYFAQFLIEKKADENSTAEVIAMPKLYCIEGEVAKTVTGSNDDADFLVVTALVPNDSNNKAKITVFLKENHQVVIDSQKEDVEISN